MIIRVAKWVAGKIMRLVPERILGRILPGKFAFDPDQLPKPPEVPDADARLLIAPVNYAGQGWLWARAVTEHIPGAAATNMVVRTSTDFSHPANNIVPLGFYAASRRWQRMQREAVIAGFSHVMVESEKQPFGALLDESVRSQIDYLQRHGLTVFMLCHGSDIRLPSRHIERNPASPFLDSLASVAPALEKIARGNRRLLDRLGLPVLVSTPDLILDVPYASWLPVVVDPQQWAVDAAPLRGDRPVVVHAPSSGSVKGSEIIDPILRRMDADGLVSYRRVEGVPFGDMPEVYRNADIVIDQIRLGDYGVAACEAMAAGRVVVGHVSRHAREFIAERTGGDLPVIEATAESLESVIRTILADPDTYRRVARASVDYVTKVHDGRMSAEILRPYLV